MCQGSPKVPQVGTGLGEEEEADSQVAGRGTSPGQVDIKGGGAGHQQASGLNNWKNKTCFQ